MTRHLRRAGLLAAGLVLAACTSGRAAPPPAATTAPPERLVVLGGDSAFGADLPRDTRLRGSWSQLVLAALPSGSTMVDLATRGAGLGDVASVQAPIASQLHPTIAVIALEGPTDGDVAGDLSRTITALRDAGAARVVVVDAGLDLDDAARSAVSGSGATVVDGSGFPTAGAARHEAIATAVEHAASG